MKKLVFTVLTVAALVFVPGVQAAEVREEIICPQPYGGGVVCGVKIHETVEAGVGDNLQILGSGFLGASAVIAYVSKRLRRAV